MTAPRRAWPAALDLALAAGLGALHSLPFVHTGFWWLQLLCVALLAWRVSLAAPWRAAALGLAFGTAWLGAGTWWLFISLHRYGGLPAWMAVTAVALLSALLSLYLASTIARPIRRLARLAIKSIGEHALGRHDDHDQEHDPREKLAADPDFFHHFLIIK